MTKRRTYTKEFKIEAVRLLESGDKTAIEITRDLDIRRNQLHKRRRDYRARQFYGDEMRRSAKERICLRGGSHAMQTCAKSGNRDDMRDGYRVAAHAKVWRRTARAKHGSGLATWLAVLWLTTLNFVVCDSYGDDEKKLDKTQQARELYRRANEHWRMARRPCDISEESVHLLVESSELGYAPALEVLGQAFDPNTCPKYKADPAVAAQYYHRAADRGQTRAMKRWADLVDEGLTDATPFADKAEFYLQIAQWHVQFDRSGLSTSIDKYFGEAMRHGSNLAHETLKERVASGDERAALVLEDVLLATDNSGSSREEAIAWLRRCDRTDCKNRLAQHYRARSADGTATVEELRWLVTHYSHLPARSYETLHGSADHTALVLLERDPSAEARRLVVEYFYSAAGKDKQYSRVPELLGRAFALDDSANREGRRADALVGRAFESNSRGEIRRDSIPERIALVERAVQAYEAGIADLNAGQIARLAVLSWMGFGTRARIADVRELFADAAKRGDLAAVNTVAYLASVPAGRQIPRVADSDVQRRLAFRNANTARLCDAAGGAVDEVLRSQRSAYRELLASRGVRV